MAESETQECREFFAIYFTFAFFTKTADSSAMSSRELVIDLVNKLPEDAPLADIAREIELLAGIQKARQQVSQGEGVPAEDARKLVDAWASK
ncbi:MAG TPA: hypothetical protein VFY06_11665 [Verrucomicrobiae bacterium]|nr:hypothetical protein [Verrucomicrobiae bacterium]